MHPILFQYGRFQIFSYGALIALGGVLSSLFWLSRREQMGMKREEDVWLLINVILFGGFVGGRVLFLFEYVKPFSPEFWSTLVSLNKGFSVMGAFVGVVGGVYWLSRRLKLQPLRLLDYVCQAAPLWHAFGRLGCFAAGCCFGVPTKLPWGVRFTDPRSMIPPEYLGVPIHPTQLYEAAGNLLIAAGLYFFALRRLERGKLRPGILSACYFLSYGVLRFLNEFVRGDIVPTPYLSLTAAQWFSIGLAVLAAVVYAASTRAAAPRAAGSRAPAKERA